MRLEQLEAKFVGRCGDDSSFYENDDSQQGVLFLCPKCFAANGGAAGTHSVLCWFANPASGPVAPAHVDPKPRWTRGGNSIASLSLQPSVLLSGEGCGWHGWVTNGDAT